MKSYHLSRLGDLLAEALTTAESMQLGFLSRLIKMTLLQLAEEIKIAGAGEYRPEKRYGMVNPLGPDLYDQPPNIVGSWEWDLEKNTVVSDPEVARLFGLDTAKAKSGLPIECYLDSVFKDDLERLKCSIERTIHDGSAYSVVYRVRQPDRSLRWVFAIGKAVVEDGQIVRFPGTIIDITNDEKRKQRAIKFNLMPCVSKVEDYN
ncbi:MAG: PAS domain-containing protein [Xanthobacteraceae bacterium]|nr:PAS domain-containing protein [Xanthobacteraceae bacterium]